MGAAGSAADVGRAADAGTTADASTAAEAATAHAARITSADAIADEGAYAEGAYAEGACANAASSCSPLGGPRGSSPPAGTATSRNTHRSAAPQKESPIERTLRKQRLALKMARTQR